MKKAKKLLVALLVAAIAVTAVVALAACGGDKEETSNTKSYQLVGTFAESLGPLGEGYEFMLNLNTDGTSVLSRYNPYSYDAADAATNTSYTASFMSGTWKEAQKDGVDCLQIKLAVQLEDGTTTNDITAYAIATDGTYAFDLTFPLVVGQPYSRTIAMSGGETKTYSDANAFIQAKKMTFTPPESVAQLLSYDTDNNEMNGKIYVQEDGTLLVYSGYTKFATGKYYREDTTLIILINDNNISYTKSDNEVKFSYAYSMAGMEIAKYNFVIPDFTTLPAQALPTFAPKTYTGTVDGDSYTISLQNAFDCTYGIQGVYAFPCSYTIDRNNVITLTLKSEPTAAPLVQLWNTMKDIKWTLGDDDTTMTGEAPQQS